MVFFRMLLATLCLFPFARGHYRDMRTQLRTRFLAIILIGAALAFMQGFLFTGLGLTTAITASIVFSIWPIVAIILAALLLGERFTPWQAAGVILCFGGVLVIVARGNVDRIVDLDISAGDFWILGAVAGMAIYTILLKRVKIDLPPLPLLILLLRAPRSPLYRSLSGKSFMTRALPSTGTISSRSPTSASSAAV